jgi:phage terminase large subunit GpA-like protein
MFAQIGTLAVDSYLASVNADVEASEKKQNQFVWALPWEPKSVGLSAITQTGVLARSVGEPRLVIPPQCSAVTVGADVRKMEIHWTVIAWCENKSQIVDYGVVENPTNLPLELAIREGLRDLKNEIVDPGWTDANGNHYPAARVMVDSGWQWETIDAACAAMGSRWMPVKGFGGLERHKYAAPLKRGGVITRLGECYHVSRAEHRQTFLASIDTGYWKSWLFERLSTEIGQIGAMTLFQAQEVELLQFAHHITAERQVEGPEGEILWKLISRHNHWLDATAYACVAGHFEGVRLFQEPSATRGPVTDWFKNVKKRGRR